MEKEKRFNSEQLKAISHVTGPMLVLAGPGSGKTTIITHRVKSLIEEHHIDGNNILVITYTRAAAIEMEERFNKLMKQETRVTFGTFHSVFFMMLKRAYGFSARDIITDTEKYALIKNIIDENKLDYDAQEDFAGNIIGEIGFVKGGMLNIDEFESKNMKPDDFKLVYGEYDKRLRKKKKLDFDDMLVFTYELLKERPDIRKMWQSKYRYILIDEFQDINSVQYKAVRLLLSEENNFFAVGDDDQSVYSFRGADPKFMLDLPKDFPNLEIVSLGINYRCSREIVDAAGLVISNNKNRYDKNIVAANDFEGKSKIQIIKPENISKENQDISERIRALKKDGTSYEKMAVIYRTNSEVSGLVIRLMQDNIPYKIKENVPDILSHFTSVNITDYIRLAQGNRDRARVLRVINRPNRFISRDCFINKTVDFDEVKKYYKDNNSALQSIVALEYDLERIKKMKPFAAVNYIRKAIGYDDYIKEYGRYKKINPQEYFDVMDEFQEISRQSESIDDFFDLLNEYHEKMTENKEKQDKSEAAVTLATMHGSKGLEFDYVFIMNGVEGVTPHKRSVTDEEIEEERRMFYVALTRAKYGLTIYTPEMIYGKTGKQSRFIGEMYEHKKPESNQSLSGIELNSISSSSSSNASAAASNSSSSSIVSSSNSSSEIS